LDEDRALINPILSQALGYAEWVRGEQIHPRTLAVNTASILQGIQFFCPLNKYLKLLFIATQKSSGSTKY